MKIGIDIFSFDKLGTNSGVGPGVYVWKLLPELIRQGNPCFFYVFCNNENNSLVPKSNNVKIIVSPFPSKNRLWRIFHEQIFIPWKYFTLKLDLVHFFGNNISYLIAQSSVITVYDLMWKYYLTLNISSLKAKYFRLTVPLSIKLAKSIITISKFVGNEVRTFIPHKNNIYPILLAPGEIIEPTESEKRVYGNKYSFPFIFTVTTSMPHKNVKVLLDAFLLLKKSNKFTGKLVIAGQLKGNFHLKTLNFINSNNLESEIVLSGFISESEKTFCYQNAEIFVYPSLYEGFGLPILEAFQCGVPVIASNRASIPEVGGNACVYFNPESSIELFQKIVLLLSDKKLKDRLQQEGRRQFVKFSWRKTAEETLSVYSSIPTKK